MQNAMIGKKRASEARINVVSWRNKVMKINKVAIAVAAVSFACGAAVAHYVDCREVAGILQSDDISLTRNVEQANALLDVYEQALSPEQQQKAKDSIPRDVNGKEE